ncbi:MAG: hypothetical protein DRI75_01110 [Bacteroidetes bacterium]|nr:MAG: hypothetical protein DRI75_01110 [Bacteroidota bacterium]
MKKIFFFGCVIVAFWSCSLDDSSNEDFHFEILPIESASVPTEMRFGEVYTIHYSYFRPSSCHFFNDLYYVAESNIRTIAVINIVLNANENNICESLTNTLEEKSFNFVVNNIEGTYVFKFWQGEDENGQDIYLVYEVPVTQ